MRTLYLMVFLVSLSLGVSAFGKTPDGMTPAEEGSCTYLEGRAYGQCNAFCEAKDCDSMDPMDWNKSCYNLLEHYQDETGKAGPPCFCNEACGLQFDECVAGCQDAEDPQCCRTQCSNSLRICDRNCCNQDGQLDYLECVDTMCGGIDDENCFCLKFGCVTQITGCIKPVPLP